MKEVLELIEAKKLIKKGDKIGVAVSGGADSMALLHLLNSIKDELGFSLMAITVNHKLRAEAQDDVDLVQKFCDENNIKLSDFEIDVKLVAEENKQSIETAAREVRYGVFNSLLAKKIVSKIALAHHKDDQAETVLMNLFRGAGANGIKGMESCRNGVYIRPMLAVTKKQIYDYIKEFTIPFTVDQTNLSSDYTRNYVRNVIMPLVQKQWPNAVSAITNFSEDCARDNEFILSQINLENVLFLDKMAKVPQGYFEVSSALVSRTVFGVLKNIGVMKDIERKHVKMITDFALNGETGKKLHLPNKLVVIKEYDFIVFQNKAEKQLVLDLPFKVGKFVLPDESVLHIKRVQLTAPYEKDGLYVDADKVKTAHWRYAGQGDVFEKFGGGTKSLKKFLVDKKVASRERKTLPLLVIENEVLVIAGVEISDKVKITDKTKSIYKITLTKK